MIQNRREYLTLLSLGVAKVFVWCTDDDGDGELEPVYNEDEEEDELRQMGLLFGDTIEHPDGFRITPFAPKTADRFESDTIGGTETIEPENEQFVLIELEVENISGSTIETPNTLDFQAIVDGRQYERTSLIGGQPDGYERYPSLEKLAPGSTASGEVIFDTPSGEVELFYHSFADNSEEIEAIWS